MEKFLFLWATQRNVQKDIVYQTNFPANTQEIEGMMPEEIIFACYGAYVKKYEEAPADYDKVYVYADETNLEEIKKRFPKNKGYSNLIVLKSDSYLKNFGPITPNVQLFADLWNLEDWYAKEFLTALKQKMSKIRKSLFKFFDKK
ncbi:MAG: hypothetical protein AAB564_02845 [Patescibacteria group bacterium]